MEGKGRSSLILLFQQCSNFSSRACRYIFKLDLMRRCHLNRNCLILPCVDTKGEDGAKILKLQPNTVACVFLPGVFGEDGCFQQPVSHHGWGAWNQPHSSRPLCFSLSASTELVQHFAPCLACYPVLLLEVGLEHPELPCALGKAVKAGLKAGHHCPGVWLSPTWAAGCHNGQCCYSYDLV